MSGALSASDEHALLRTLIDHLPDRIYVMDKDGRKTLSNLADWKASGGKSMEDVLGKTDFDTYPLELAEQFWAVDKTVLEEGNLIINHEEPGLDQEGKPVSVLTTKVPLRDADGNVVGLVGIGRDITELKRAEAELIKQKTFLEALNLHSPAAIVVLDRDGDILSCNPAFEKMYGYVAAEIAGKNLDRLIATDETLQEATSYTQQAAKAPLRAIGRAPGERRQPGGRGNPRCAGFCGRREGGHTSHLS